MNVEKNRVYTLARLTMVAIACLAVANIAWVLLDKSFDFVAMPALTEIVMMVEIAIYDASGPLYMMILLGAVIAALLAVYAVCGLRAKKSDKSFTVGFVFYVVDYVFRLYLILMDTYPDTGRGNEPVMLAVRALIPTAILVILIVGKVSRNKQKQEETV